MAGQTINDRLLAARHSLSGQGLAKSVCKATTEEMIGPKKKHLDYLVHCTNEPNVSIPNLANLLIERSQNTNWVVVYKALITVHHLLAYGNERFMQYLASSNSTFNLSNFLDKSGVQGTVGARIGYDMSPFIRRYAKYLNEKALSYRTVAFDFCKVKRGKEEGSLRTMNADKLLKTLPVLQSQLDALLEFDCSANDLTNGVINMCFMLLFRDLIRLFACYNDGIINLLEKYFDMNKKQCRDALDLYKKFLVRMDRVGEFLKVAENVGIDKGDIPDLTKAPSSLLDALEQHLATLEGKKGSAANTPTQSASNQKNVKSGVSALSSTSSSFGTAAASTKFDSHANGIDENIKAQALAEEEAAMNQYKSKISSPISGGGSIALTNPFLSSPPASQANAPIVDLFGSADAKTADLTGTSNTKASDDLLQLGNPFADMFGAPAPAPAGQQTAAGTGANKIWMSNGFNGSANVAPAGTTTNAFVSDSNFSSVFGNSEPASNNYLQAAADDKSVPNPFFFDGEVSEAQSVQMKHEQPQPIPSQLDESKISSTAKVSDDGNASIAQKPPIRPPPPSAKAVVSETPAKSAFDDLNDSIQMALGSPAKVAAPMTPAATSDVSSTVAHPQFTIDSTQSVPPQQGVDTTVLPQQYSQIIPPQQMMGMGYATGIGGGYNPQQQQQMFIIPSAGSGGGLTQQQQQQQQQQAQHQQQQSTGKIFTGDLDSSLASLVDNLNINKSGSGKGMQWNSPKNTAKPGANWTPQPMAATTGVGYRPMAQGMTVSPAPSTLNHQFVHATYPVIPTYIQQGIPQMQPMMGAPGMPMMGATPGMIPVGQTGMPGMPMAMPTAAGVVPGQAAVAPGGIMAPQQQQQQATQPSPAQNGNKTIQLDPFGAL